MESAQKSKLSGVKVLALVNSSIWALAIIALVFVIEDAPQVKGMFPILAGGIAVATALITSINKEMSPRDSNPE